MTKKYIFILVGCFLFLVFFIFFKIYTEIDHQKHCVVIFTEQVETTHGVFKYLTVLRDDDNIVYHTSKVDIWAVARKYDTVNAYIKDEMFYILVDRVEGLEKNNE